MQMSAVLEAIEENKYFQFSVTAVIYLILANLRTVTHIWVPIHKVHPNCVM